MGSWTQTWIPTGENHTCSYSRSVKKSHYTSFQSQNMALNWSLVIGRMAQCEWAISWCDLPTPLGIIGISLYNIVKSNDSYTIQ